MLFEHRQNGLAAGRRPAPHDGGHLVVDKQLTRLLCEGRPVRGSVFLNVFDLAAQDPALCIDLINRQLLGLD